MKPVATKWKKVRAIIEKNFKILLRSKSSALIIVLGPLFLIFLIGLAYNNTDPFHINVGVYSSRYSQVTESVLQKLSDNSYDVEKYPVEEACVDSVKRSKTNICILFPPDLDVKQDTAQDIIFYVDPSDINLVHNVLSAISLRVENESKEISRNLTNDLLARLAKTEGEADSRVPTVVQLTREYDSISDTSNAVAAKLFGLELSGAGTGDLGSLQAETNFMKQLTLTTIDDSQALISSLRSEIEGKSGMEQVEALLAQYEDDFLDYKGDYRAREESLNTSFSTMYTGITEANAQLQEASTVKTSVETELAGMKDILDRSLHLLNEMQISLNNIKKISTTLEIKDAGFIVNPITTKIVPILDRTTHFNYAFPTILVLLLMITGILLGSILVMVEKRSSSFFRNSITPTVDTTFMIATALTALIIMAVQLGVFLLISSIFFDASIFGSFFTLLFVLLVVSTAFVFVGIFIGTVFRSEETTILAGVSVASLFLLFSSTILPIENMSFFLKKLAGFNPFVISETMVKEALFFDVGLSSLAKSMLLLIGYIAVLAYASLAIHRKMKAMVGHGKGAFASFAPALLQDQLWKFKNKIILNETLGGTVAMASKTISKAMPNRRARAGPVVSPTDAVEEQLLSNVFDPPDRKSLSPEGALSENVLKQEKPVYDFILQPEVKAAAKKQIGEPLFPSFPSFSNPQSNPADLVRSTGLLTPGELLEMKQLEEDIAKLELVEKEKKNAATKLPSSSYLSNLQHIDSRLKRLRHRTGMV